MIRCWLLEDLDGVAVAPAPILRPLEGTASPSTNGHHAVTPAELHRPPIVVKDAPRAEYRYITDAASLAAILPNLAVQPIVGLDTETCGLDEHTDDLRLVQIATPETVYVVDAFTADPTPLAAWLADTVTTKVLQNAEFDLRFLLKHNLTVGDVFDPMLAGQLLTAGIPDARHNLAALARTYLGEELPKDEQRSDWSGDLTDNQLSYAARDAALLLPLHAALATKLKDAGLEHVARLENRAAPAVAWLRHVGCPFDADRWRALADAALLDKIRALDELNGLAAGVTLPGALLSAVVNWNSPEQVRALLAATGLSLPATDAETLAGHQDHPVVAALLRYRDAEKRRGAYGLDFLDVPHKMTGRIHADWRQLGAVSGRMSCDDPNLQNVPRIPAYRACFRAPAGRALIKCDFSQVELRLAAEISGDATLIAAYRDGLDVHTLTARKVLGATTVTQEQRQTAKSLNFGLLFGAGAETLRRYAASTYRITLSPDEAERFRAAFFAAYPGLVDWHERVKRACWRSGATETRTLANRRRLFPAPTGDREKDRRQRPITQFLNSPVQGSGADAIKAALAFLWERRDHCPDAFPVLVVHDELVVECDADRTAEAGAWLLGAMRDALGCFLTKVPVGDLEVTTGRDWSMREGVR